MLTTQNLEDLFVDACRHFGIDPNKHFLEFNPISHLFVLRPILIDEYARNYRSYSFKYEDIYPKDHPKLYEVTVRDSPVRDLSRTYTITFKGKPLKIDYPVFRFVAKNATEAYSFVDTAKVTPPTCVGIHREYTQYESYIHLKRDKVDENGNFEVRLNGEIVKVPTEVLVVPSTQDGSTSVDASYIDKIDRRYKHTPKNES